MLKEQIADTGHGWTITVEMPETVVWAGAIAALLQQADFRNHIECDVLSTSGSELRLVHVTVQFARGLGPAGKANLRPAVVAEIQRLLADLPRLLHAPAADSR